MERSAPLAAARGHQQLITFRIASQNSGQRSEPLGFVDAAVFVACVALGEEKVATLDRRHFSVLRTEAGRALDLLPTV